MKGVYVVLLRLEEDQRIEIGALGEKEFSAGIYAYAGSGRNSVESRIERHRSHPENLHWHIDYLSERAEVYNHLVLPEESRYECVLADILSGMGEPVEGFGSSDCDCPSHLYYLGED